MAKLTVYEQLSRDAQLTNASSLLHDYYTTLAPERIMDIARINERIDAGDYTDAQIKITAFAPETEIQYNYKQYYQLWLKYVTQKDWDDESDGGQLYELANQCAYEQGSIVYQARTLYNAIYRDQFSVFNDECGSSNGSLRPAPTAQKVLSAFDARVYPVPAQGDIYVSCNAQEGTELSIDIYDVSGKIITSIPCIKSGKDCVIEANLANGMYYVTILNKTTHAKISKKLFVSQ
jgi:hypothetical protein